MHKARNSSKTKKLFGDLMYAREIVFALL